MTQLMNRVSSQFALAMLLAAGVAASRAAETAHDAAQAIFMKEAARVLAWVKTQEGIAVESVTATVTYSDDGAKWHVEWMAKGKKVRAIDVEYSEVELSSGIAFY